MTDGSAKSLDFFQDNELSNERSERKYTATRIKSRNFLSNISYVGINKQDFYNDNFICDVYLFMTKDLNSFSLDRKLNDPNKYEMIYIWYGKSAYLCHLINFYAKRKISFISTERFTTNSIQNNFELFKGKLKKTMCICLSTRTSSSTFIQMCTAKYTVQRKEEVSTSRTDFISCLKLTRTKKDWTVGDKSSDV